MLPKLAVCPIKKVWDVPETAMMRLVCVCVYVYGIYSMLYVNTKDLCPLYYETSVIRYVECAQWAVHTHPITLRS